MAEKTEKKTKLNHINMRILLLPTLAILLIFGILVRGLIILQLVDPENYKGMAEDQQMRIKPVAAQRGSIYDRNMEVMARSAAVWKVVLDPSIIQEDKRSLVVSTLAEILKMDPPVVAASVYKQDTQYAKLKGQVEGPEKEAIEEFIRSKNKEKDGYEQEKIQGIFFEQDFKRYYTDGNMASTVLGFTGTDQQGVEGLEAYYNDWLAGINGRDVKMKNAVGTAMPYEYEAQGYSPQNGYSLKLTLDRTVQQYAEKELRAAIEKNQVSNRGCVIVMDVNTGAILAMATEPGYNLNDPFTIADPNKMESILQMPESEREKARKEAAQAQWRNKAVSDTYEPGSVFKIITAAATLETGTFDENSNFYCSGEITIADRDIGCWKKTGHGNQTFAQALMHSCNPAFVTMSQKLGKTEFFKYFKAFGMTEKTGVDLPGESQSIYYTAEKMGPVELAIESFGQTFNVTPIQIITAVSASINGGNLLQPYIVDSILDDKGNVVQSHGTTLRRQVISEDVSKKINGMLEQVVSGEGGSGKNAYVQGYRIGGKTGTSEKTGTVNPINGEAWTISSFVGIAPANDPQYAVLLLLDEPYDPIAHASTLAAPHVGDIFRDILPYLGVEPQYTEAELATIDVSTPNYVGKESDGAKELVESDGFVLHMEGKSGKIVRQTPSPGTMMKRGSTVVLYTEDGPTENKMATVPNVVSSTSATAKKSLEASGLNALLSGGAAGEKASLVISQGVNPGDRVPIGTVVKVVCIQNDAVE